MSAISGIYHRDKKHCDPLILARMAASMVHRGPDRTSVVHQEEVGFAHGMLYTTPESLFEALPAYDYNTSLMITADARLDNREELAESLAINKHQLVTLADSDLLLLAYRKWGEDCVKRLLGDFAFSIWDKKLQQLLCVRDHMGIKPLYYYASDSLITFASELRAILHVPQVPRKLNEGRVADLIAGGLEGIDKECTFYQNILRLPPALYLKVTPGKVSLHNYWQLGQAKSKQLRSKKQLVDEFGEIFTRAVKDRLRCNTAPASMLSGGLDSSAIVGVARNLVGGEQCEHPLRVYSATAQNREQCREHYFSQLIVEQGGVDPIAIRPSDTFRYQNELMHLFSKLENPFDAHMIMPMLLYLVAKENCSHVILDGVDGDMVHSLPPFYPAFLLRKGKVRQAVSEVLRLRERYYPPSMSMVKLLRQMVKLSLSPNWLHVLKQKYSPEWLIVSGCVNNSLLNRAACKQFGIAKRYKKYRQHSSKKTGRSLQDLHIETIMQPDLTVGIERYDRVAALCSIEPRHPLLDKRLVEFSVDCAWDMLVHDGWSKFVLRSFAQDFLPAEVCWRKGRDHIGYDFTVEMLRNQQVHKKMMGGIRSEEEKLLKYVNKGDLNQLTNIDSYSILDTVALGFINVYSLSNLFRN